MGFGESAVTDTKGNNPMDEDWTTATSYYNCSELLKHPLCNSSQEFFVNFTQLDTKIVINSTELPPNLGFDENAKNDIIVYSILFVIAAAGNLTVFFTLFRNRHWKSRVNLMIMHLAAADLMVTFIMIPLEVGWRITTQWVAGNPACKVFLFLRAFGLYSSSMVLVCISLDRYFAILHPLKVNDAQRRGKLMLGFAWTTAAICSIPQSIIFHVDTHPEYPSFHQCVTFGFFTSPAEEMAYNVFCLSVMYFLPLLIIIVVYVRILWEISQKSKDSREENEKNNDIIRRNTRSRNTAPPRTGSGYRLRLRRSDMTNIERARARTLRMTIIIVLAFIWCWTPYVVMVMWYMFDRKSAEQVDRRLQDALFIMAVSNSCVNPLVYGTYNLNLKNELSRCFRQWGNQSSLVRRPTGSTGMRATASTAFNSSISSRHALHAKVLDCGGYTRSTRLNFPTPTEEANLARRCSKASLAQKASSQTHLGHGIKNIHKQEYSRGRMTPIIASSSQSEFDPHPQLNHHVIALSNSLEISTNFDSIVITPKENNTLLAPQNIISNYQCSGSVSNDPNPFCNISSTEPRAVEKTQDSLLNRKSNNIVELPHVQPLRINHSEVLTEPLVHFNFDDNSCIYKSLSRIPDITYNERSSAINSTIPSVNSNLTRSHSLQNKDTPA